MSVTPKDQTIDKHLASFDGLLSDPADLLRRSATSARVRTHDTGELKVLSAESYPHLLNHRFHARKEEPHKRKAPPSLSVDDEMWYGGIILRPDGSSQSHESSSPEQEPTKESVRPKKKARKASKNEDQTDEEGKKQRGRPRLDTRDETAADRRRTQIRLAQRAYRHRKESTISDLKSKVTDLQSTIQQMNKTFLALHDNLVDAGLANHRNALSRQLQAATVEFEELVKAADFEPDEEAANIAQITGKVKGSNTGSSGKDPDTTPTDKKTRKVAASTNSDDGDIEELPPIDHDSFGYMNPWSEPHQDVLQFNVQVPEARISFDDILAQKSSDVAPGASSSLINLKKVQPAIERPLVSPSSTQGFYTYSFQETTFARRLQRMALERAFRNLTNPDIDPAYIKRAFRFTFCFSNRKRILQRFKMLLQRKAGESLENFNVPFFNIGGAGTHFPQIDNFGNPMYPPNMLSADKAFAQEKMGPLPRYDPETPRGEHQLQETLDAIGFGGVWFDSHDVEEYLKTKGIYLDGRSSFIDVDPSLILPTLPASIPSTASTISSSTSHSPILRTPSPLHFQPSPVGLGSDLLFDPSMSSFLDTAAANTRSLTFAPDFPHALGQSSKQPTPDHSLPISQVQSAQIWPWNQEPSLYSNDDWLNGSSPEFEDMFRNETRPEQQSAQSMVTIDIEKFLERMIDGAACLGRAPGFRRELIDNAILMSLSEAF